ncbi:transport energizing protein, ExbD/TolR family [Plesiocystis pacifica SIR-1]|uniref:Transport energizing protein, ExbD/TolR family n=1 Tax=Plesiocystis pacifica SIR-1 TaxID=391625 RepID=A6G7L6_9BACT|nr:biopolymer transporter ExbD [Plesiocystis pacifica]EDM78094.1 transport energizing protein, ExbD/TolR family [Plesiocystis pacifica SIR-1]
MASGGLDDDGEITGINITPMVDIILVLLVIFMVTTTTINEIEGMEVDKPDAASGKNVDDMPLSIILMCRGEDEFAIDGTPVEGASQQIVDDKIAKAIKARVAQNADLQGIVQCDTEAQVGAMVHLIDLLRENGVSKYAIATEQPKRGEG